MAILYALPGSWLKYDLVDLVEELTAAKAAVLSLTSIPFQRSWAEKLQAMELKREVAGTSRIEGADFTERELDDALSGKAEVGQMTRSQRQARAAIETYRWIAALPKDRPLDVALITGIHRRVVTGCDEDHCPPGQLRGGDENVLFGRPRHRGVDGGKDCVAALTALLDASSKEFKGHDPLIQALALHYHFAAMHPFLDGNGRTARAVEALMLQKGNLKDTLFIAMSNYYYDEKDEYLSTLSLVRQHHHNLTPFLKFGLKGIALQCNRLLREIRTHVQKSLFRDVMNRMYGRLQSTRKRALAHRQLEMLTILLDRDTPIEYRDLFKMLSSSYNNLGEPLRAFVRDLNGLSAMNATSVMSEGSRESTLYMVEVRPDWATEITETEFYARINSLPQAKTRLVLTH